MESWAIVCMWTSWAALYFAPFLLERLVLRRPLDPFSPMGWELLLGQASLYRPLVVIARGWQANWVEGGYPEVSILVFKTLVVLFLGRVALLLAYYSRSWRWLRERLPACPATLSKRRTRLLAAASCLFGFLVLWWFHSRQGGLIGTASQLYARRWLTAGLWYPLLILTAVVPVAIWLLWGEALSRSRRAPLDMLFSGALVVAAVGAISSLGGRGAAFSVAAVAAGLWHYKRRRLKWVFLTVAVGFAILVATVLEDLRGGTTSGWFSSVASLRAELESASAKDVLFRVLGRDDGFDRRMRVLQGVPDVIPFQYGKTYLRIPASAVPRAWWPDKPGLSEASVYASLFGQYTEGKWGSYPAGIIGSFYLQGGTLAVVIGCLAQGLVMRAFYERYVVGRTCTAGLVLYLALLLSGFFTLSNLGIVQGLQVALPLWLASHVVKLRRAVAGGRYPALRASSPPRIALVRCHCGGHRGQ